MAQPDALSDPTPTNKEDASRADEAVPDKKRSTSEAEETMENYLPDDSDARREDEDYVGGEEEEGFVRKYLHPESDNVEDVERYQPGGYHPVAMGDILGGYEIVHKLGFGGFSTVWLGWDVENKTYAAIKIYTADAPDTSEDDILEYVFQKGSNRPALKFIESPVRHFNVSGPNGDHLCTASNILGPSIAQLTRDGLTLSVEEARRAALQLTQCVSFLHSKEIGIAHGDLTTSNVLLEISNIDHWPVEELNEHLGKVRVCSVYDVSGELSRSDAAPEYLVEPIDPMNLFALRTGNIKVIDFAESFRLTSPPENGVGTPFEYCSPELFVHKTAGKASDIWALACSIFEMRAGEFLISPIIGFEWEILSQFRMLFGPLPASLRGPEVNDEMRVYDESWTLKTRILGDEPMEDSTPTDDDETGDTTHLMPQKTGERRRKVSLFAHFRKWLASIFRQWWSILVETIHRRSKAEERKESQRQVAENRELKALYDLLNGAFNYDVEERLTAEQMLLSPWLSADQIL